MISYVKQCLSFNCIEIQIAQQSKSTKYARSIRAFEDKEFIYIFYFQFLLSELIPFIKTQ